MTLLDLTTGYATFADGGMLAKPYTVLEIRRPNGDVIYSREPTCRSAQQHAAAKRRSPSSTPC